MIAYILKVSLCWLFFYGVYELFLKNKTFFSANRSYLLITLVAGVLLPLLEYIPWKNESNVAHVIYPVLLEIDELQAVVAKTDRSAFDWHYLLYAIYALGVIVSSSRLFVGVGKIVSLFRKSEKTRQDGFTIVSTEKFHLPFSFFRWVFFSKKTDLTDNVESILQHEIQHIKGRHTIDVLATEILKVVFWCSPLIYLYKNALREIHEFLADQVVLKKSDKISYKKLLLAQTNSSFQMALTHQFFSSHLKNRIKMINQKRSGRPTLVMYALGIPVLMLLLFAFTFAFNTDQVSKDKVPDLIENMGSYYVEEDPEKVPYFQIDGEDIDLPLYKHISLYGNIGNTVVMLPEDAVKKFGARAKLGYVNFENPVLKTGSSDESWSLRDNREFYHSLIRSEMEVRNQRTKTKVKRDFVPSAGKNMQANLMAGITSTIIEEASPVLGFTGSLSKDFDIPARIATCEGSGLSDEELSTCATKEMYSIVYENLSYPKAAMKNGVHGTASVTFVVNKDGELEDFRVRRDIGGNCGKAAVAAAKELAKYDWIPATKDGENVNMRYLLPVRFGLTAEGVKAQKKLVVKLDSVPNPSTTQEVEEPVYTVVEQMPRFPGCESESKVSKEKDDCARVKMLEFLYSNLKYPKEDREAGIEGMVVVKFIVTKKGEIEQPKIVRALSDKTSIEVLRMVDEMNRLPEKWTPGFQSGKAVDVYWHLPVRFKIEDEVVHEENSTDMDDPDLTRPYVEVDNKEWTKSINDIDPEIIESIKVTKGQAAIEVFGQKGKNGVVMVYTKGFKGVKKIVDESSKLDEVNEQEKPKTKLKLNTGNKKPLIVIDGVIKETGSEELDPDDIAEVHVLKDAKATKKYGVKGANGVVEITLKASKAEKPAEFDTPAYFPGCESMKNGKGKKDCSGQNLLNYIYSNLKYPSEARDQGIQGTVVTSFIINPDGRIGSISLKREKKGLSDSALKVVAEMADEITWEPAMKDGKPVAMEYHLPISYKIHDNKVAANVTTCDQIENQEERNKCRAEKIAITKKALEKIESLERENPILSLEDVSIFPNPARESVNLKFTGKKSPLSVRILNVEGKSIYSKSIQDFNGKFDETVNLQDIDAKMLLVRIEQDGKVFTEKLILE